MEDNGDSKTIPFDAVIKNLGIEKEELLDTEDIDMENH
jgi:hypothetical protein